MLYTKQQVKRMNPIEQADLAQKWYDQGYDQKYISQELYVTIPQISNLRTLASLPLKMKQRIINNQVAATLVLEVIRENPDLSQDDAIQIIEDIALQSNNKVTKKAINKQNKTSNSISVIKKIQRQTNINNVTKNQDVYELLLGINEGRMDRLAFLNYFGIK